MRKLIVLGILFVSSDAVLLAAPLTAWSFNYQQASLSVQLPAEAQKQKPKKTKKQHARDKVYSKEDILKIQKILSRYDYYDGPMDGKLNDELKQAIRDFQDDENLPKTGELDEETYKRIISLQAEESNQEPPRR
ncbi:MAG: peptidoglycan-binding domain-containing protein [Acidobacteriota bacterium]|nr:peptidoglycan-binding protein [Blastocatellia bacterium]MDW8238861.1 peptidoglycan-binding domain-containing protein [Acidobacteriota bacterium]